MKFIHISDIHLVPEGSVLNGGIPSDRFEACLQDIERHHKDAEFCVISGDLTEFAEPEAYAYLARRLARFPLPVFLMIGNHDTRETFLRAFPGHPVDEAGFIQYRHQTEAGVFLFLDTTRDGIDVHEGQLCALRLNWLRAQLEAAGDKPVYVFMHHPPFDLGIPYVDEIKLVEADAFAEVAGRALNLRHVFYGHVHRMTYVNWHGIPFTSLPSLNHQIPLVAASVEGEFCDEPPAYAVITLAPEQMTVHFNTFLQRNPLHQT